MEELLRLDRVTRRFGDRYALREVSFSMARGEILTVLGDNGAGKSTLTNLLSGVLRPTEGRVLVRGQEVRSPRRSAALGVGVVRRVPALVDSRTVRENLLLGPGRPGLLSGWTAGRKLRDLSALYGLTLDLDCPVSGLPPDARRRVELLRALYRGTELVVLDEPSDGLTAAERDALFALLRRIARDGRGVLLTSRKPREAVEVSDRIVVLRAGTALEAVRREDTDGTTLAAQMTGRAEEPVRYEKKASPNAPAVKLDGVVCGDGCDRLDGASLEVRRGEIVGVAGAEDCGQRTLARLLSGDAVPEAGTVELAGAAVKDFSPAAFLAAGVARVPENADADGLIGTLSVAENLSLGRTGRKPYSWLGIFPRRRTAAVRELARQYGFPPDTREVRTLSRCQRQKVVLAREVETASLLLTAFDPLRDLDTASAALVRDRIVAARDRGAAVLLLGMDLEDLLPLSDRVLVLYRGRVVGEFSGVNPPVEKIRLAMAGTIVRTTRKNRMKHVKLPWFHP